MSVSPLPNERVSDTGVIALPVARSLFSADRWDVLLILGVVMLVTGIGMVVGALVSVVVGVGSALGVAGLLFMLGGLYGARNSAAVPE